MSKKTKRTLGIIAATVLVVALCIAGFVMAATPAEDPVCYTHGDVNGDGKVNKDDAIYLLYASFPGLETEFPMNQDGKMDDNDVVNKDDAIYLLYASVPGNEQSFPLKGEVHSYYDPTWVWNEADATAKVTFKCGCSPNGHEVDAVVTLVEEKEPTCVEAGSRTYSAKATFDGKEYATSENKVIVVSATGQHALNEASCTEDLACANCDYEVKAPGHSMVLKSTEPATCTADGAEHYKCENCTYTEDVTLTKLGHDLSYLEGQDMEKTDCTFVKQYKCSSCNSVFDGEAAADTYVKHSYVTKLTKEATCCADGEMTTACEKCGSVKETETLPMDTSKHAWDNGTESAGKLTFACTQTGCDEEKVEVVANDGKVDTTNLDADTGVNLGNKTSVAMDQTALDKIGDQQITISVEQKDKTQINGLSAQQAAQIPSDTVYDFSITDANGQPVSNFGGGLITVTLPYELQEGDDINSIDIWYITDDGQTQRVSNAVYSNGFVTFQTGHFSYYTVTRLTPVERCARLGSHIEVQQVKAATCTQDGYNMTVCQRCGEVISKEIFAKTGHKYSDSEKAATCTESGLLTRSCTNGCGHVVTKTLPALGHDMKQDTEKTVAATCSAAGKSVKACSRCEYTAQEPLTQLTHKYEKSAEKSVAATCSTAGYDVHVCELCGDEQKKNDTAPLGHSFVEKKDGWNWTNNTTAVVTLVCENDDTHTKELSAVVTKNDDKSQNTSCLGSGSIVYEAAVSYNGKTYTSVNEITVAAPGHKPGTAWQTSDTQHYHLCTVCEEKLEAEAHAWNEGTVTKEPTCKEAGSRTVKCTVCDYEKTQTISATGEHNFVNGVCTGCGTAQTDCRHLPINKSMLDTVALGLCDGVKVCRYSCDCGQVVEYEIQDYDCQFGKESTETTKDKYGFETEVSRATCEDCGLQISLVQGYTVDEEKCLATYDVTYQFHKNGELLAEDQMYYMEDHHPGVTVVETEVIEHEYLCGDIIIGFKQCICGEYTRAYREDECSWGWGVGPGYEDENSSHAMCSECYATMDTHWEVERVEGEFCQYVEVDSVRIGIEKFELYTYTDAIPYERHDTYLSDYEMMGESCTDGVLIQYTCNECQMVDENFVRSHSTARSQRIEIGEGYCADYLIQYTCLCDAQYSDCVLAYETGNGCNMEWGYDKETGQEFWMCYECGLRYFDEVTYDDKDENCACMVNRVYTYKNAEGETVAVGYNRYDTVQHELREQYTLKEGAESCEDGVTVYSYCVDCDYEHTYEENYHSQYLINTYDLSAFDGCVTEIEYYRCACGQESYYDQDEYCNQQYIETGVENQEAWKCIYCGIVETITTSNPETNDPCLVHSVRVHDFSKEGVDATVRFTYEHFYENHRYIYDIALNDGATSCYDGWSGTAACQRCGDVQEVRGYWHETYTVSSERVDNGKMCGPVESYTNSCACGNYSSSDIEWTGDTSCTFNSERYDSVLDTWIYTCSGCGSYYYQQNEVKPSETDPCRVNVIYAYRYFDKDGNALFERTNTSWYSTHNYCTQFLNVDGTPWTGTDCSQGFRIRQICATCGTTSEDHSVYTECETYTVAFEQVYDGTGMCGPVKLRHASCACGKRTGGGISDTCQWKYSYDNQVGKEKWTCTECGAYYYNVSSSQPVPNETCRIKVDVSRSFYADGELLCTASYSYYDENHRTYYVYSNQPESCEQGWQATIYCADCDDYRGSTSENYDHSLNTVEYRDLSQYGMCGGYLSIERCACGQRKSWSTEDLVCEWDHQGTDANDVATYYCSKCDTYIYRTESGSVNDQCQFVGSEELNFVRNDQSVLNVTVQVSETRHDERVVNAWLQTPGTSCTDGIVTYWQCRNCDYGYESYPAYHYTKQTDIIETACGAIFRREACCCGEQAYVYTSHDCTTTVDRKYTGDNWNGTLDYTETCDKCGIRVHWQDSWTTPEGACEGVYSGEVTIEYEGQTYGWEYKHETTSHKESKTTYSLKPGASTCEDGLVATEVCAGCGYTNTWYTSGTHYMNLASTLDLKQYGATCGGELRRYLCACESVGRYELDDDTLCKLQRQETEVWIENVIDDAYSNSTDHNPWIYSNAWTYTCAVTEPACDLRLRVAEYWLQEGCAAVEYQSWEYFDASTNQWVTMDTMPTGKTYSWHNYIETKVDTVENGANVTGTKYDCACGAYYYDLRYDYADGTYKTTVDAFDGQGVNDNAERHQFNEYMCIYNNNQFVTKTYYSYKEKSGYSYWEQNEYTYDFADNCKVTRVFTGSNSDTETTVSNHICATTNYTTEKYNSCTQYGKQKWEDVCAACDAVYKSGYNTILPTNHHWFNNGEAGWKCYDCGLENQNGASDGIILEDLTATLGNGVNYVAGYWNKDEVEGYITSVCAVVEGQDPIYLTGIEILEHDSAVAVYFNIAQAHAAADAVVGGAQYELRLNFVGEGVEYAITFTDAQAQ